MMLRHLGPLYLSGLPLVVHSSELGTFLRNSRLAQARLMIFAGCCSTWNTFPSYAFVS